MSLQSGGSGNSTSTLHLAALAAIAAMLGLGAGAAAVYLVLRREADGLRNLEICSPSPSTVVRSPSNSSGVVPLFDSVQRWLRTNSGREGGSSTFGSNIGSARSNGRVSRHSRLSIMSNPPSPEADLCHPDVAPVTQNSRLDAVGGMPLTDWEIQESEIEICKRPDGSLWHLGAGSYGQVFKAMRSGSQPVAVKVFPSDATEIQLADFQKEVVILKSCRDRNIVQFLGACVTDTQTCLVTEYMECGDLYNGLHRNDQSDMLTWYRRSSTVHAPCSRKTATHGLGRHIALDIARGLHFLHTHRIVHMDVKSPNVLLGHKYIAKLADVGLAKFLHKDYLSAAKSVGTFAWSAPEVLMGGRCSEKVDIFSFGVVLWEIVTGESPSRGRLRQVRVPDECSEAVADLISACMEADPSSRPSASDIVDMLSATGNEAALRSAADRRKEKRSEIHLGPGSAKVMGELLRHAALLGIADYTHSDALLAVSYQDDFKLYHRYISEMKLCMEDGRPPAKGTPKHSRLLELVASTRSLLSAFLAENTDTAMELRNVDMTKGGRQQGSDAPDIAEVALDNKTTLGTREEVDWRPTLEAMQLAPGQAAAVMEARASVTMKVEELTQQRRELIQELQTLAAGGPDSGYTSAVEKTEQLRKNMANEGNIQHEYHYWFFCAMLTPIQEACVEIKCHPFFPDSMALSDLIVKDAVEALGNAQCSTASAAKMAGTVTSATAL